MATKALKEPKISKDLNMELNNKPQKFGKQEQIKNPKPVDRRNNRNQCNGSLNDKTKTRRDGELVLSKDRQD